MGKIAISKFAFWLTFNLTYWVRGQTFSYKVWPLWASVCKSQKNLVGIRGPKNIMSVALPNCNFENCIFKCRSLTSPLIKDIKSQICKNWHYKCVVQINKYFLERTVPQKIDSWEDFELVRADSSKYISAGLNAHLLQNLAGSAHLNSLLHFLQLGINVIEMSQEIRLSRLHQLSPEINHFYLQSSPLLWMNCLISIGRDWAVSRENRLYLSELLSIYYPGSGNFIRYNRHFW